MTMSLAKGARMRGATIMEGVAVTEDEIDREIEKSRAELIKVRRFIHMNTQLPGREEQADREISGPDDPVARIRTIQQRDPGRPGAPSETTRGTH